MLDELFCEAKIKNENPIAEEKDFVRASGQENLDTNNLMRTKKIREHRCDNSFL